MKNTLEKLWNSYQMENPVERNEKSKRILREFMIYQKELNESLNEKGKEELKKYEKCLSELAAISERQAFVKGIRFATRYLIEAIRED